MNTRKDFRKAADLVKAFTEYDSSERRVLTQVFVRFFSDSNPNFDATRFVEWIES